MDKHLSVGRAGAKMAAERLMSNPEFKQTVVSQYIEKLPPDHLHQMVKEFVLSDSDKTITTVLANAAMEHNPELLEKQCLYLARQDATSAIEARAVLFLQRDKKFKQEAKDTLKKELKGDVEAKLKDELRDEVTAVLTCQQKQKWKMDGKREGKRELRAKATKYMHAENKRLRDNYEFSLNSFKKRPNA